MGKSTHRRCRPLSDDGQEPQAALLPEVARIITGDRQFQEMLDRLPLYATTDLPVLIMGEPGTGKELVAEAIWALSPRREQPFFRLNCAVLVADLACSELFGHLRGSFTGADQSRAGKFKLAHRGTLFLDEVGDLPVTIQPRLLRAVEQGEIEPVGGDLSVKVDVRLIAATNQSLPQLVAQGRFRQDLYDRLAVLAIFLPPLRERGDDVVRLAQLFLEQLAVQYQSPVQGFSPAAVRRLKEHAWLGNVRELKNVITRAVLHCRGSQIKETDLALTPKVYIPMSAPRALGEKLAGDDETQPARPDQEALEEMLAAAGGNISALARRFGVCTKTVYRWLQYYQLDLKHLRTSAEG
jgi:DNA-binding NtrC family response regulator